jgi:pimeloyl-ACP methyl ester carboxylesterase
MKQLQQILAGQTGWTLIGSSYGGMMATVFTLEHEEQLRKLVLPGPVREIAKRLFSNLTLYTVEDDHRLHKTVNELDWNTILGCFRILA